MTKTAIITIVILFAAGLFFFLRKSPAPQKVIVPPVKKVLPKEPDKPIPVENDYYVQTLRTVKKGEKFDRDSVEDFWQPKDNKQPQDEAFIQASYRVIGQRAKHKLEKGIFLKKNDITQSSEDMR